MAEEKNKKEIGRPPLFDSKEALQEKIEEYFKSGMKIREIIVGKGENKEVVKVPVPTITGLVLFCGFESRQSFYDLEKNTEFSYTIKRARTTIENHYEEGIQIGNTAGSIFALKNLGWADSQKLDLSTLGESINDKPDYSNLSPEEVIQFAKLRRKSKGV
jgi:hypothetical protein